MLFLAGRRVSTFAEAMEHWIRTESASSGSGEKESSLMPNVAGCGFVAGPGGSASFFGV